MTILTWNGQDIEQRELDGYVNATEMCQANGKRYADWSRLDSTKAYLDEVACEVQICTSQLVISKKGNSSDFEQGTWVHPLIAIAIGQWISPKFHVWCNKHIKVLMETGSTSIDDTRQDLEEQFADTPSLKDIKFVSEWYGELHGKAYQESYVHQKIRRFYPALAGDPVPPQHRASLPESRLLTPTEIASELGFKYKSGNPNPRQVNTLLEKLGYQVKVADKWDLTELGRRYGVFKPIDTNSRSDKDQLMWQSTLIDVLKEFSVR